MKKIHFVGIGGSGISGVFDLAKLAGYEVSGCDLNLGGHDEKHIEGVDLVVVTPAVFFQSNNHPEIVLAKEQNKLMTWQEFLGRYLQDEKEVICVAGTHGKSTTTAMASLLFEEAQLDPSVMVGATVKEWNANYRYGQSKFFITEADEFYNNFLNYSPEVIILNNIEFDHPDFFKNDKAYFESFKNFILKLKGKKILIYNEDDLGIKKLFKLIGEKSLAKINLYGYSTKGKKIKLYTNKTSFEVDGEKYTLKIPGIYNVSNTLGVIILAKIFKISTNIIIKTLENFDGIGRRIELIGEKNGAKVYDDYAHHPTAIKKTLEGLRQKYPKENILAIIEPHTFSRTKALLPLYKNAFKGADEVIIAPIFRSRDKEDFGIIGNDIVKMSGHKNIKYLDSFEEILKYIKEGGLRPGGPLARWDVIIVMGAGDSYKLAREIYAN